MYAFLYWLTWVVPDKGPLNGLLLYILVFIQVTILGRCSYSCWMQLPGLYIL